jgi:hypothetical protein
MPAPRKREALLTNRGKRVTTGEREPTLSDVVKRNQSESGAFEEKNERRRDKE